MTSNLDNFEVFFLYLKVRINQRELQLLINLTIILNCYFLLYCLHRYICFLCFPFLAWFELYLIQQIVTFSALVFQFNIGKFHPKTDLHWSTNILSLSVLQSERIKFHQLSSKLRELYHIVHGFCWVYNPIELVKGDWYSKNWSLFLYINQLFCNIHPHIKC